MTSFFRPERQELHITFKGKAICSQNRINSHKSRCCFGHYVASLLLALQWKTQQPFLRIFLSFSESFFCSDSGICGLRGSGRRNTARWKTQPAANPEGLLASLGFLPQCYLLRTCCKLFFSECLIPHSVVHAPAWPPWNFAADAITQLLCKSDHKVPGWVYRKWERNI